MPNNNQNIYQRRDGRWEGRIYKSGTHKYRSVYAPTYEQAREKMAMLKASESISAQNRYLTLGDVIDLWLESRGNIKPTSLACYHSKITEHILPFFENIPYTSLTPADLERFKTAKLSAGFSDNYIASMVVIIKSASKYAAQMYGCCDPFALVAAPKIHKKAVRLLSSEEQKSFTQTCLGSGFKGLGCFLSLYLGLRIGEVCGLKWENIDLTASILSVHSNAQRVVDENGESRVMILTPKTDTSIRDIPIPGFVADVLRKYVRAGKKFVLSGTTEPIEPRAYTSYFKALQKKAGVKSINYHSLRHCFATNFLRQTGDVKSLSEILGHANAATTLRIYVHSSMEQKMSGMEKMAALL